MKTSQTQDGIRDSDSFLHFGGLDYHRHEGVMHLSDHAKYPLKAQRSALSNISNHIKLSGTGPTSSGILALSLRPSGQLKIVGDDDRIKWVQPSGPRQRGEGTEDMEQDILSVAPTPTGGIILKITLLAAGFLIGTAGSCIREVARVTGADIRSWTEPSTIPHAPRPCRAFSVEGGDQQVALACHIMNQAVYRYKELCEGKLSEGVLRDATDELAAGSACIAGRLVPREQIVHGVFFSYQPPPRHMVPHAAALEPARTRREEATRQNSRSSAFLGPAAINGITASMQAMAAFDLSGADCSPEGCRTVCSGSAEVLPANMAASSTSFAEPLMGAAMYMPFNSSPFDTHNFTEHCNQNEMPAESLRVRAPTPPPWLGAQIRCSKSNAAAAAAAFQNAQQPTWETAPGMSGFAPYPSAPAPSPTTAAVDSASLGAQSFEAPPSDAVPGQENSMSLFSGPNFSLQTSPNRSTPAKVTAWGSPHRVSTTPDEFGFDASLAAPPTPRGWFSAPTNCPPTNRPREQSPLEQTEGPSTDFLFHHTTAVGGAPAALRRPISTVFQSQGVLANGNGVPTAAAATASSPSAVVAGLSFSAPSFTPFSGRRCSMGGLVMAPLYDYESDMEDASSASPE